MTKRCADIGGEHKVTGSRELRSTPESGQNSQKGLGDRHISLGSFSDDVQLPPIPTLPDRDRHGRNEGMAFAGQIDLSPLKANRL